jgi:phage-related protein
MREYLYFNGKSSADFEAYITNAGVYESPLHSYDSVAVPGRNGNLIFDNDKFDNVTVTYPAVIVNDFDRNFDDLKAYLLSINGYQRLSDTFHPDEYYQAVFKSVENIKVVPRHNGGTMNIVFERKPQKFLKSGETMREYTGSVTIKNPTRYKALPLIRLYGSGTLTIGDISLVLSTSASYVDIDCDMQEALQAGENQHITLTDGVFPYLTPGNNTIQYTGSRYQITPRWFTV